MVKVDLVLTKQAISPLKILYHTAQNVARIAPSEAGHLRIRWKGESRRFNRISFAGHDGDEFVLLPRLVSQTSASRSQLIQKHGNGT